MDLSDRSQDDPDATSISKFVDSVNDHSDHFTGLDACAGSEPPVTDFDAFIGSDASVTDPYISDCARCHERDL